MTFSNVKFGWFQTDDIAVTLRANGADVGLGGEVLVIDVVGNLCASGYPNKLTHQDVIGGLYPAIERE